MPYVVFNKPFYDGERRYKEKEKVFVPDDVKLPTRDILTIDGKPFTPKKAADPNIAAKDAKIAQEVADGDNLNLPGGLSPAQIAQEKRARPPRPKKK